MQDQSRMTKALSLFTAIVLGIGSSVWGRNDNGLEAVRRLWQKPTQDYRMKTWWFFGYEQPTDEGITADAEALRDAGFGRVVYYDQNHARDPEGAGAEAAFSETWWHHLQFAASEASRCGLSFEVNISNGYCAGGRWIDPPHAMQRVAAAEARVDIGNDGSVSVDGSLDISGPEGYVCDIALLAWPLEDDGRIRHLTARYVPRGKGRNGAMQRPGDRSGAFSGYGFENLPDIGMLQASHDGQTWRDVTNLEPMYNSQGGYRIRTTAFPPAGEKFWRIRYADGTFDYGEEASQGQPLQWWRLGSEARIDRWEELAALQSDFAETGRIPLSYTPDEVIAPAKIHHLEGTDYSVLPAGRWKVLRLAAVLTGAKSKHGRPNLLGYECDKLSAEAANLHWNSYVQPILDRVPGIAGVTMDSHEGGSQNWTPRMLQEFRRRRGYDLGPWLPALAGYVVESAERTRQVLYDFRQTISDCIRDNYFGTFQQRASENGISFTAQAIGNALCITGDAISVKQVVDKPQGEFWTYQRDGAYDIKDCSSSAHLYGKPIASAEAMTDCEYRNTPADLQRVGNIAFAMGAQEFVVCATPHIPYSTVTQPYIAGREYAINRSNPQWEQMKPVWLQAARSMVLLRQGRAAPDVLVFLGDDVPVKTLTSRLPSGLDGLDWDVCTADALRHRLKAAEGRLTTPDGVSYQALIIDDQTPMTEETRQLIGRLRHEGIPVLRSAEGLPRALTIERGDTAVVHTHRHAAGQELFYLGNKENYPLYIRFRLQDSPQKIRLWDNAAGIIKTLRPDVDGLFSLTLPSTGSVFISY